MTIYVYAFIFIGLTALFYHHYGCLCNFNIEYGVDFEAAQEILDLHNYYRSLIQKGLVDGQPRGYNLKKMEYDLMLGLLAQEITDGLSFTPSLESKVYKSIGFNTYLIPLLEDTEELRANWPKTIKAWFDENRFYTYGNISNPKALNYTQLVWEETEYVGCGYSKWKLGAIHANDLNYTKYYACLYAPGGNEDGKFPYNTSTTMD